jgi:hypothetical protein
MTDAASDANRPDRVEISHVKGTVSRQTIHSILSFLNSATSQEDLIQNFVIDGVDRKVAEAFIQVIRNTGIQGWTDFFRGFANYRNFVIRLEPSHLGRKITDVAVVVAARSHFA